MRGLRHFAVTVALLPAGSWADDSGAAQKQCLAEQSAITAIGQKYRPVFEGFQKEGDDLKSHAATFSLDVRWTDIEIKFKTPSVTINNQRLAFGVPQFTLKTQDIAFGSPSVRMQRVKTGQYPQFYCDTHTVIPKCTTRWSDTYAVVPQTFMEERRIRLNVPEFKLADTTILIGIPEFFMQPQRIVFDVPQFKVTGVVLNSGPLKARSDNLQRRVGETRETLATETADGIHVLYACYRSHLQDQRQSADSQFQPAFAQIDATIQSLRSQGADPTKVATSDGTTMDLVAKRAELTAMHEGIMIKFDDALKQLDRSEKDAVDNLQT